MSMYKLIKKHVIMQNIKDAKLSKISLVKIYNVFKRSTKYTANKLNLYTNLSKNKQITDGNKNLSQKL